MSIRNESVCVRLSWFARGMRHSAAIWVSSLSIYISKVLYLKVEFNIFRDISSKHLSALKKISETRFIFNTKFMLRGPLHFKKI